MSRIAKQPITLPAGTTAKVENGVLVITGKNGTLSRKLVSDVKLTLTAEAIQVEPAHKSIFANALSGTFASHIKNMIEGVDKGFEKKLTIEGVGLRYSLVGTDIKLDIGFSHPVMLAVPEGIKVVIEKSNLSVTGIDKEAVGGFAAKIRSLKKTEPYKGKGIRYVGEIIRRKQGKKASA